MRRRERRRGFTSCRAFSGLRQGISPREIEAIERREGVRFVPLQKVALQKALSHSVLILTGGPGTGKTTTIKGLIALLEARRKVVALAAPTGRAAQAAVGGDRAGGEDDPSAAQVQPPGDGI